MRKFSAKLFAAALAGTAALALSAGAQAPQAPAAPKAPMVVVPAAPMAMPMPPMTQPAAPMMAYPAPVANMPCGGTPAADCSSCGGASGHKPGLFSKLFGNYGIGAGTATPVTCGCHAADKTFVFGSCKQFFNPGNVCGSGCGFNGRNNCPLPTYAAPYGAPGNNCAGPFSYLNR